MIILDKPYVSDYLKNTIKKNNYPTISIADKTELNLNDVSTLTNESILGKINGELFPKIYSNSENSIGWVNEFLTKTRLPDIINLFKDKYRFRKHLENIYPDFYYKTVPIHELNSIDPSELPFPIVLKPVVGFFSMGVYKILAEEQWSQTIDTIKEKIEKTNKLYPSAVLDANTFIIEEYVEGEEFAFDAYFNENGEPVVLNIFHHLFSSDSDVGDRVYLSSAKIIRDNLESFTNFLVDLGKNAELKNFPLHVEVRITEDGSLFPIEVNPLRFGGWCTTADSTFFSYGLNSIECFFNQAKPDWNKIFYGKENKLYSIIVLDNSTGYDSTQIKSFDYERLLKAFEHPLEFRKMNVADYNVFGFLFCETNENNFTELEYILKSDLKEFVEI